ncbi:12656_t:CDS:1 [Acaulospora morrowiae]|uniref:12656_t:CDS:1 n=1 Tax=Acaulospora morrowiae TaxID=94023 RepID=A0A9N8VHE5_9GLOM|nr:12656_t:CDS:1 [Acaulospora morrowiae]
MLTFTSLPNECESEIFEHLVDDRPSLYNCLFVNRFWCKNIVPLLWRKPFNYRVPKAHLSIRTYLSALNVEEQRTLIPFKFGYNQTPLLFEYGAYLENFNCGLLFNVASVWLKSEGHNEVEYGYRCQAVVRAITKMLMRTCRNLKSLNLASAIEVPNSSIFKSSHYGLSKLVELSLCLENNSSTNKQALEILSYLSSICRNLRKTHFIVREEINPLPVKSIDSLVSLISNQHNLKIFDLYQAEKSASRIISSLQFQQDSLTTIFFSSINFSKISDSSLEVLIKCKNIVQIKLIYCDSISLDQVEILSRSQFTPKVLILNQNTFSMDIAPALIKIWGLKLKHLDFDQLTQEIVDSVTNHCLNLSKLTIKGSFDNLDSILPWIKKSRLKAFSLERTVFRGRLYGKEDLDPVFTDLGKNLPNSLNYLRIKGCKLMENALEQILGNCQLKLLETLLIQPVMEPIEPRHLTYIKNFLRRNKSVKKVEINFHNINKNWGEDEERIFNEIRRELGIEIITTEVFNS